MRLLRKKVSISSTHVTFPRIYSNIGEKGKIRDTSTIPQLTRFRSHEGVVALVIYIRITFFYTRVTYMHRTQVCLTRHTDVHKHRSFYLHSMIVPKDTMRISFSSTTRISGYVTNLKVVDSPNFPASLNMRHRPENLYLPFAGAKTHFRLNDINEKARNCNETEFQGELFPASWEKTATANQFYNGLSSFPEIDFSPLLQLLALAYTTPRVPAYARRYFYVIVARWISSKGCKSNNQNVRTFLRWNTATVLRAGFSSMKSRFCWRK